ncbi:hypothetical protein EKG37_02030 [Robertmurraya yapensis]|uniref:Flagellar hook-length control protein FliK n=1 Tax=Bacillus yapensis TaxID=2492960 RepID=A0A431WL70_9BACI|nr:hypothetical protein [Bacillus yapensis]RTR36358.1 hypothetical protein EKG37_02030 [Bacillus yapensis]TKT05862.1 hypothetical protein FAR12_02030 [Bacillus yapensis]
MQIQFPTSFKTNTLTNSSSFNVGDVLQVNIKDKMNGQNAIVSAKGTDTMVKFESEVPNESKVSVEITGKSAEGVITVKVVDPNTAQVPATQKKQSLEGKLEEIIRSFTAKGIPVTKENIASIRKYLTNGEGTAEEKQKTLQAMAQKQIPISDATIKSVHEALYGNKVSTTLDTLLNMLKSSFGMEVDQTNVHPKSEIGKTTQFLDVQLDDADLNELIKSQLTKKLSESVAGEVNEEESLEFAKSQNEIKNTHFEQTNSSQLKHPHNQDSEVNHTPLEEMNKETISQTSVDEPNLANIEADLTMGDFPSIKSDSIKLIVTEITKKMSQMAIDFKGLKQDITRNLDNVNKMLENRTMPPQANIKQVLESTIHKLDNAILKGDFLLYTDMATEKKLLTASSQLSDAKKLLAKGEASEANKIVKEVKSMMEQLEFKPSDVKMKHFVMSKFGLEDSAPIKQLTNSIEKVVQPFPNNEVTPRHMYEAISKLGLSNEREVAYSLLSKAGIPANEQQADNIKNILLKMMKSDDLKTQHKQQVEEAVNSISGQQLLSKQSSTGEQSLFFQMPYMVDKQVENIKIYVNSRNEGDKLDWENCSIYFVLQTKKLGEVGVLMSSSEKNVSLTFKSDKDSLSDKVAGFTEISQERFKEIGYNLNQMKVRPLEEQNEVVAQENTTVQSKPIENENKGYDITV